MWSQVRELIRTSIIKSTLASGIAVMYPCHYQWQLDYILWLTTQLNPSLIKHAYWMSSVLFCFRCFSCCVLNLVLCSLISYINYLGCSTWKITGNNQKKIPFTYEILCLMYLLKRFTWLIQTLFLPSNWNLNKIFVLTGELGQAHMAKKLFLIFLHAGRWLFLLLNLWFSSKLVSKMN